MKSREPFALAGIWENWQRAGGEEWLSTFAIITTNSNELVSAIHNRMPVIIAPKHYDRWLSPLEPDPSDLLWRHDVCQRHHHGRHPGCHHRPTWPAVAGIPL